MSEDSGEDDLGIKAGTVIDSAKANYVVVNMLGEGGFGAVFKVYLESDKTKEYALKVEKKLVTRKHSKLKMEIAILKLVSPLRPERPHFTKIIDRGKKSNYFFIVMDLVGKSLNDLKNARPNRIFSLGTGLGVANQCLEAIEDLHSHGFIHRDIKPENYAIGLGNQKHIIYILDFGIARKIVNKSDLLKTPRAMVGFKGTLKFASLACHRNEDMAKKDDCESWLYLFLELVVVSGLPWKRLSDKFANKDLVKKSKENSRIEFHADYDLMYVGITKIRPELVKILSYIDSLTYEQSPDYDFMQKMLKEAAKKVEVSMDPPYDWM